MSSSDSSTMTRRRLLSALLKSAALTGAAVMVGVVVNRQRYRPDGVLLSEESLRPNSPLPDHLLTPVGDFYVQSYALLPPTLSAEEWRLTIDGAVTTPLTLTLEEVQSAPQQEFHLTMECIGNQTGGTLIGNALWTGTPLQPFLERSGLNPDATEWLMHGADSYETTLPVAELLRPDVYLVHQMNGAPLTADHGYPVRIIIPGHYGQKQPKWLVRLEAIAANKTGYWERQGWSNTAIIPTHSLVRQIQAEQVSNKHHQVTLRQDWEQGVVIAGVALDGTAAIDQVLVSTDNGTSWQPAEQNHPPSPHEWTLWRYHWQPRQPGRYTILAKARSATSQQPLEDNRPKDGSSGVLRIQVTLAA